MRSQSTFDIPCTEKEKEVEIDIPKGGLLQTVYIDS